MKQAILIVALASTLGACTWGIKLDSGGENVRVAWNAMSRAQRGQSYGLGAQQRRPGGSQGLKVRDELEIMARNEAAVSAPTRSRRKANPRRFANWNAYTCGPNACVSQQSSRWPDAAATGRRSRNVSGQGSLRQPGSPAVS